MTIAFALSGSIGRRRCRRDVSLGLDGVEVGVFHRHGGQNAFARMKLQQTGQQIETGGRRRWKKGFEILHRWEILQSAQIYHEQAAVKAQAHLARLLVDGQEHRSSSVVQKHQVSRLRRTNQVKNQIELGLLVLVLAHLLLCKVGPSTVALNIFASAVDAQAGKVHLLAFEAVIAEIATVKGRGGMFIAFVLLLLEVGDALVFDAQVSAADGTTQGSVRRCRRNTRPLDLPVSGKQRLALLVIRLIFLHHTDELREYATN